MYCKSTKFIGDNHSFDIFMSQAPSVKILPQLLQVDSSTPYTLQDEMQLLYPVSSDRAELLVAVAPDNYTASAIAHAVEDCNMHLINMNVTPVRTPMGHLVIALRVDGTNIDAVARSLQRYGFEVIAGSDVAASIDNEEAARRAAELLHLLEI